MLTGDALFEILDTWLTLREHFRGKKTALPAVTLPICLLEAEELLSLSWSPILRFWPTIDSALRAAACARGVQVRLMVSCWQHSPPDMFIFLQSLQVLKRPPLMCDIDVVCLEI